MARDKDYRIAERMERFGEDWEIRPQEKIIARKEKPGLAGLRNRWLPRKHPVHTLYRFLNRWLDTPDGVIHPTPIDRGPFVTAAGSSTHYYLRDGWRIPEKDLKYLIDGPLFSEDRDRELVPEDTFWVRVRRNFGKILAGLAVIFTILMGLEWIVRLSVS